ncbi:hypothetical protein E2562_020343 [Oryza meyeriana var. granulata]|uniref:Uncharacterized protein n=1 Tax=Oryza meyeriana var. granulata TaxID=110450 RepID=A0A6G1ED68_9ORYZ|nr:hypothetical protein E2562_020343 [Oryza meyeriana var. granulata]
MVHYLGDEDVDAGVLVVLAELVDGLAGAEHHLVLLDVLMAAQRLEQPRHALEQLVLFHLFLLSLPRKQSSF